MAKEEILLREEMGRLEIEPIKLKRSRSNENPFILQSKRGLLKRIYIKSGSCSCPTHKKSTNNGISKKKQNKILKEPVLQILKTCVAQNASVRDDRQQDAICPQSVTIDSLNLCTLVKNCIQLKISSDTTEETKTVNERANDKTKWWKNEVSCSKESREVRHSNQAGSCSQQVLNPPCDVTIDELASYFETLVHIPKKMSSMAEMMYI